MIKHKYRIERTRDRGRIVRAVNGRKVKTQSRNNCTYKLIGTKTLVILDEICQPLQISQGLSIVLLRSFVEEDSANRQVGVGRIGRPVTVSLNILSNIRNITLCV